MPTQFNPTLPSPKYFSPTTNPFSFFPNPTPRNPDPNINSIQGLAPLDNTAIDEFQSLIKNEIQSNLSGEGRSAASISTIGSPGSAFRRL